MLQAIAILGGWLLMMGQHYRSESLFYYFRIEDQVPQNHLLRFIDRYVSFDFVREKLRASYSETGRPSIDPEVLLRILLLGYLYGITSERKLLEELRMHLAWRWFTGLGFEQEIPHHSTFSLSQIIDPHLYPEISAIRNEILSWRFYHHFRTDLDSPLRQPQIGVQTTVLSHDGSDLAAALQTILEIGDETFF